MKALRTGAVSLLVACAAGGVLASEPISVQQVAAARVHAQDLADLFLEACLQSRADPQTTVAWARSRGFVPGIGTRSGREVIEAMKQRGETGHVFARGPNDESVLLIATANPSNCVVMGLSRVDGPRLRGRMEALAGGWSGMTITPEPVYSMDYDEDVPHRILRYTGVSGPDRYRLTVVSPLGIARGTAIMGISVEPGR